MQIQNRKTPSPQSTVPPSEPESGQKHEGIERSPVETLNHLANHFREYSKLTQSDALGIHLSDRPVFYRRAHYPESYRRLTSLEFQLVESFLKGDSITGSLELYVNNSNKPAFHIKAAKVLQNEIQYQAKRTQLTSQTVATEKKLTEDSQNSAASAVAALEQDSVSLKIAALQRKLEDTQAALEQTYQRLEHLEQTQKKGASVGLFQWTKTRVQTGNQALQQKLTHVQSEIALKTKRTLQFIPNQIKRGRQAVEQQIHKQKQSIQQGVARVKQAIVSKVQSAQQGLAQLWIHSVIESSLSFIAQNFGTQMPDGTRTFVARDYHITRQGDATYIVRATPTPSHRAVSSENGHPLIVSSDPSSQGLTRSNPSIPLSILNERLGQSFD